MDIKKTRVKWVRRKENKFVDEKIKRRYCFFNVSNLSIIVYKQGLSIFRHPTALYMENRNPIFILTSIINTWKYSVLVVETGRVFVTFSFPLWKLLWSHLPQPSGWNIQTAANFKLTQIVARREAICAISPRKIEIYQTSIITLLKNDQNGVVLLLIVVLE